VLSVETEPQVVAISFFNIFVCFVFVPPIVLFFQKYNGNIFCAIAMCVYLVMTDMKLIDIWKKLVAFCLNYICLAVKTNGLP
jgi:hypothetical protein